MLQQEDLDKVSEDPAGIRPTAAQPTRLYLELLTKTFISLAYGVKREIHMYCPVWPKLGQQNGPNLTGCCAASDHLWGSVHT